MTQVPSRPQKNTKRAQVGAALTKAAGAATATQPIEDISTGGASPLGGTNKGYTGSGMKLGSPATGLAGARRGKPRK